MKVTLHSYSFEFFSERYIFKNSEKFQKYSEKITNLFNVIIARYPFSSDIVKTLPIYYFMLFEYMCGVSKLLTIQKPRK